MSASDEFIAKSKVLDCGRVRLEIYENHGGFKVFLNVFSLELRAIPALINALDRVIDRHSESVFGHEQDAASTNHASGGRENSDAV